MLNLADTIAPDDKNYNGDNDIYCQHPPRQPPGTVDGDFEFTFLIADGTVGTDSFYVKHIVATTQVLELHTVQHGIAVTPVVVATLHPVHKLQSLTLVVVAGSKLDGEGVLAVLQFYLAALVEG